MICTQTIATPQSSIADNSEVVERRLQSHLNHMLNWNNWNKVSRSVVSTYNDTTVWKNTSEVRKSLFLSKLSNDLEEKPTPRRHSQPEHPQQTDLKDIDTLRIGEGERLQQNKTGLKHPFVLPSLNFQNEPLSSTKYKYDHFNNISVVDPTRT